jgi:hypothetical protein
MIITTFIILLTQVNSQPDSIRDPDLASSQPPSQVLKL